TKSVLRHDGAVWIRFESDPISSIRRAEMGISGVVQSVVDLSVSFDAVGLRISLRCARSAAEQVRPAQMRVHELVPTPQVFLFDPVLEVKPVSHAPSGDGA